MKSYVTPVYFENFSFRLWNS